MENNISEKIELNVEGMTCSNCAMTVRKALENEGLKNVAVDFGTGSVRFNSSSEKPVEKIISKIEGLGYHVAGQKEEKKNIFPASLEEKFIFCLIFTIPLLLHMFLPFHLFHNPIFQLVFSLPVFAVGVMYFGKSAYHSIRSGIPNMDVLIIMGSSSAMIYSLAGIIIHKAGPASENYMFFETAASIITLVLLGNLLEKRSVRKTTDAIRELSEIQVHEAKKIIFDLMSHQEKVVTIPADQIQVNDVLLITEGEKIPTDGLVNFGEGLINESMVTGESLPVFKKLNERLIGGTLLQQGVIKMKVTAVGENTVLSNIIQLVKDAQSNRPEVQKLGDRVSAIFVPAVLLFAFGTFLVTFLILDKGIQESLLRFIAVLVVSCPCAMGLATPTAVMVGLGRSAKNGVLIKGGSTLEDFSKIKTIIFDKTGTLTNGNFSVQNFTTYDFDEDEAKNILYNLEENSSHPIAESIRKNRLWKNSSLTFSKINEEKGIGIKAEDDAGNQYSAGSWRIDPDQTERSEQDLFLFKNGQLVASLSISDEIKSGALEMVNFFKSKNIRTVLLSGDSERKSRQVSEKLGFDEVYFSKLPSEKLEIIESFSKFGKTAMVGDGINDAPSLTKSDVGISMGNASEIARQSARIVLINPDIVLIRSAWEISSKTYRTIKQNLFWAFFYNVVTIPIAAAGFLHPMLAAMSMAFSDVIVVGNSLRLNVIKINSDSQK